MIVFWYKLNQMVPFYHTFLRHGEKRPQISLSLEKKMALHEFFYGKTFTPEIDFLGHRYEPKHGFSRALSECFYALNLWMNGIRSQRTWGIPFARYIPEYIYSQMPYIDQRVLTEVPNLRLGVSQDRPSVPLTEFQGRLGWQLMMILAPDNYAYIAKIDNEKALEQRLRTVANIDEALKNLTPDDEEYHYLVEAKAFDEKRIKDFEQQVKKPRVVLNTKEHKAYCKEMEVFLPTVDLPAFQDFLHTMATIRTNIWRDADPDFYS